MNIEEFKLKLDKEFGEGALVEFDGSTARCEALTTGIPSLDLALGVGGLPRGRLVEIFGPEGAGKTTVALKVMAMAQKLAGQQPRLTYEPEPGEEIKSIAGRVGFIDVEHAFDPTLAELHGVKMGKGSGFYFSQPMSGADAMKQLSMMVDSGLFDVIVLDSVAGLFTEEEEKMGVGEQAIAGVARLMSNHLRKLVGKVNKTRTIVIFINQIREKPAVMFGNPETTPGGKALKFYSSVRLRVSKGESIKDGTRQIGHIMKVKVVKNKVAPPYGETNVDLYYMPSERRKVEGGFDIFSDLLRTAKDMGIVELSGSQYRYVDKETGELHKANGQVAWRLYLQEHPEVFQKIEQEVLGFGYGPKQNQQEQS